MSNAEALTMQQTEAYLNRIGCAKPAEATRAVLDELIYAHQCSIPFETIDMYQCTKAPDLKLARVFDKIVTRHRGGYCYELNALFEQLLTSLGFNARPCLCRAVCGQTEKDPINHRGILVAIDGCEVFTDVGFGGPLPCGSVSLADGAQQVIRGEHFTARKLDVYWWAIDRVTQARRDLYGIEGPSRTQTEIEFCLATVQDGDFASLNLACSQPGTEFHDHRIANLRTTEGYCGIWDDTLTIRTNGERTRMHLPDEAAFSDALETYFGFRPCEA